jgi:hypothetical protein
MQNSVNSRLADHFELATAIIYLVHGCMGVAQKILQHFLYCSQNQQELFEFFLWLILDVPLAIKGCFWNLHGLLLPTHHTAQTISISLEPMGKDLGVITRLLKK